VYYQCQARLGQCLASHLGQDAVPGTTLLLCSALVRQCNVNGVAQRQNEWWNAVVGMVSCSSKGVVDDYPLIKKNEDGNGRQLQTRAWPDQSKARAKAAVMTDDTHRTRPWLRHLGLRL